MERACNPTKEIAIVKASIIEICSFVELSCFSPLKKLFDYILVSKMKKGLYFLQFQLHLHLQNVPIETTP